MPRDRFERRRCVRLKLPTGHRSQRRRGARLLKATPTPLARPPIHVAVHSSVGRAVGNGAERCCPRGMTNKQQVGGTVCMVFGAVGRRARLQNKFFSLIPVL